MRLNKFIAQATGMSRRAADSAISDSRVLVNGKSPKVGVQVAVKDTVTLDDRVITPAVNTLTIMINKPVGVVCSRDGQGNKTVYDLLPSELHTLKLVGRLDKNSSGLLLLTSDGQLAYELTHPKFQKSKVYKIALNKPLSSGDKVRVEKGVMLDDGPSKLQLERLNSSDDNNWKITMSEGRNRQIRRTFEELGYNVVKLHRTHFGQYKLDNLIPGTYKTLNKNDN